MIKLMAAWPPRNMDWSMVHGGRRPRGTARPEGRPGRRPRGTSERGRTQARSADHQAGHRPQVGADADTGAGGQEARGDIRQARRQRQPAASARRTPRRSRNCRRRSRCLTRSTNTSAAAPHCGDEVKPIGAGDTSVEYEWVPGRLERRGARRRRGSAGCPQARCTMQRWACTLTRAGRLQVRTCVPGQARGRQVRRLNPDLPRREGDAVVQAGIPIYPAAP